jgi:hypothetical protein
MSHEPFDAAAARRMPLGTQGHVIPGRTVSPPMCRTDPADLGQQGTVDRRLGEAIFMDKPSNN